MALRHSARLRRGKMDFEPWMGVSCYPVGPRLVGGVSRVRPGYRHLYDMKAERPLRAIGIDAVLPPVLFNRADQIVLIENALALRRVENQVSVTLSQLSLGVRNADDFIEKHVLDAETRPSIYTIWFHEEGLRAHQHVLSGLSAHHLVPLFSLISYDVERGKMTTFEAEQLYEELMDCSVAQPKIVQRELANQMVRTYCLDDTLDKAMDVVREMRSKHIRRTFVTYAPMFRLIRMKGDVDQQMALLNFMYEIEGGRLPKFLFIDVPRMMYMFGIFVRYNWVAINMTFTAVLTAFVIFFLNFGGTDY